MAYTYSKIATYTVGSGGIPSVSFLNIPQTYTDLIIKFSVRDETANNGVLKMTFNGSTTGYSAKEIVGNGATASSDSNYTGGGTYYGSEGSSEANARTANTFNSAEFYIPNYTSANYKSIISDAAEEGNSTTTYMSLSVGLWSNTAPITSITLSQYSATDFAQYSTFHLYGVKAEV